MYSSANARWMSKDPLGFAGGWNLYEYASANPILLSDPSGTISGPKLLDCICKMGLLARNSADRIKATGLDPHHPDAWNANGYLHCVAACRIEAADPECSQVWDGREMLDGKVRDRPSEMDLRNNHEGQQCGKKAQSDVDCFKCCYDKWKNGELTCLEKTSKFVPCDPPAGPYPNF